MNNDASLVAVPDCILGHYGSCNVVVHVEMNWISAKVSLVQNETDRMNIMLALKILQCKRATRQRTC
jgi:hypothetical protein